LLLFGFLGTTIFDKDRYAVDALMSMLSGDAGSLYKKIRQEKGQAYTLGASSTFGLDPGYIYIYVATSPANIADVKQEVLEQVRIFSEEPVSDEELDLAKNDLIGEHRRNLQTNSRLALRTAIDELYGLGFNDYKAYEDRVRAVTKEDVMQAAKKYLRLEAHAFVTILPEEKAK